MTKEERIIKAKTIKEELEKITNRKVILKENTNLEELEVGDIISFEGANGFKIGTIKSIDNKGNISGLTKDKTDFFLLAKNFKDYKVKFIKSK